MNSVNTGSLSFDQLLISVDATQRKLSEMETQFLELVDMLREVCPHLDIATFNGGGRDTRVCKHCGIQEVQWPSAFTTLTSPGGTWYGTQKDKSRERRQMQTPVVFPLPIRVAYSFRRGKHLDVSED